MLEGRLYYLYMLLYRPFLFIAIHSGDGPNDPRIDPFVQKCLKYCSEHTSSQVKAIKHRHHGIWFTARSLLSDGLTILTVVERMNIDVPRDWPQQIQVIVSYLSCWEAEAPDLFKASLVLQAGLGFYRREFRIGGFLISGEQPHEIFYPSASGYPRYWY